MIQNYIAVFVVCDADHSMMLSSVFPADVARTTQSDIHTLHGLK